MSRFKVLVAVALTLSACATATAQKFDLAEDNRQRRLAQEQRDEERKRQRVEWVSGVDRCIAEAYEKFGKGINARNQVEAYALQCSNQYKYMQGGTEYPLQRILRELYHVCRSAGYGSCHSLTLP